MSTRLYVGNLDFGVSNEQLQGLFSQSGQVVSAEVVVKPMGFAFVEMSSPEEAQKAIQALNGQTFEGRQIKVDLAKPRGEEAPAEAPVAENVVQEVPQDAPPAPQAPATPTEVPPAE